MQQETRQLKLVRQNLTCPLVRNGGSNHRGCLPGQRASWKLTTDDFSAWVRPLAILLPLSLLVLPIAPVLGQARHATSDNHSGYVHWIELRDADGDTIDPADENPRPYSPEKTCGRCHDYAEISHGWHFNAALPAGEEGRPGQPWIWSDHRTGTHLPLSYRQWLGTLDPAQLDLSPWQMAHKFGGFLPGGGPGSVEVASAAAEARAAVKSSATDGDGSEDEGSDDETGWVDRMSVTGPLPVDCLICHRAEGSGYSPFEWTHQIESQNFAYAPSAALGIATVEGNMLRLKDDFDPAAEDAASRLPKIEYDQTRFREDGTIFIDLVRKPSNNSCYYCHTNVTSDALTGARWVHDEDVHLRAGLACADCHRNGLDHHTVRGFEGEQHPAGSIAASLSCQGCHMAGSGSEAAALPGRFGAPQPEHKGLPPLHFDKLSCTACHSGPQPKTTAGRLINSITHNLGSHVTRTGEEAPGIVGPVLLPAEVAATNEHDGDGQTAAGEEGTTKLTPHRMMWPSFWGTIKDGELSILNPELTYDLVRRPLKVRKDFAEELAKVKTPSLSERTKLLGEERARAREDDWTDEERSKIEAFQAVERQQQINERMAEALAEIEEEYPGTQAVFVSGGAGFVRDGEEAIKPLPTEELGDAGKPYAWPLGHNVRPARQALGASGCLECHSNDAIVFNTEIHPVGVLPGQETEPVLASQLQGVDVQRLSAWNQLFQGRSIFKILGLIALGLTCVVTLAACAVNLNSFWRR